MQLTARGHATDVHTILCEETQQSQIDMHTMREHWMWQMTTPIWAFKNI